MLKKYLAIGVVISMIQLIVSAPLFAASGNQAPEAVKDKVEKLSNGDKASVRIQLNDKTEVKGYISQTTPNSFVVTDGTGQARTITYDQVASVSGKSSRWGFGRFLTWTGVGAVAVAVYFFSRIAIT